MKPSRRTFLRAAGVSVALPWLEALASTAKPRYRMVCVCAPLGLHSPFLFPEKPGRDYALTPYLEIMKEFREDLSVISGLSHPEVPTGHDSFVSFLTGAHHRGYLRSGFRNSISLDQLAAEQIGGETRFPSLVLGSSVSWTRSGVLIPPSSRPSSIFARMFLDGRPDEVEGQMRRLRQGKSILDSVGDPAGQIGPQLGGSDRAKLDEYFTSIRELEQRLVRDQEWAKKPKPKVDAKPPKDPEPPDIVGAARALFDLTHLAFQSDSTRLVTIGLSSLSGVPSVPGVTMGYHDLSHHGKDSSKLDQLKIVESEWLKSLRDLLSKLKGTKEEGASLLDRTMVFFSSNLGSGSGHATTNLPVLLAGGGFKHGQYLAFDPKSNSPLCNLFVSMLQRLGLPVDRFGSSTGTLTGL